VSDHDFFGGIYNDTANEGFYNLVKNHFLALLGMDLDYYGADYGSSTFNVNGVVFKVLEDEDDGYRSYLGAIEFTDEDDSNFFRTPISTVRIKTVDNGTGPGDGSKSVYQLVDTTDGHVWLEFGTDYSDDYYPYFIFSHFPKGAKPVSNDYKIE